MSAKHFRAIFNPTKERLKRTKESRRAFTVGFFKDLFTVPQLLTVGALGQVLLFAVLPGVYGALPALFFLAHSVISTAMQARSPEHNTFLHGVVTKKTSAQIPLARYDPRTGATPFGSQPAASGVVILHLGVRFSHPLGAFATGGREMGDHFHKLNARLLERAERDFGCLGMSSWRAADQRPTSNTMMTVYYFRDMEGLNAFAHDKIHREAWDWYNNFTRKLGYSHIGVYHEAFYSPPGAYETVHMNMPPTLLGAASVPTVNEATGEQEWVRPLVDAEVPALRSQFSRMGKAVKADEEPWREAWKKA